MRDENKVFASVVRINLVGVYEKVVSKFICILIRALSRKVRCRYCARRHGSH